MTALQLAELNGLLAIAVARRTNRGEGRDPDVVANEVLAEVVTPDIGPTLNRLAAMVGLK